MNLCGQSGHWVSGCQDPLGKPRQGRCHDLKVNFSLPMKHHGEKANKAWRKPLQRLQFPIEAHDDGNEP